MKSNLWMYATGEDMSRTAFSLYTFGAEVLFRAKVINELDQLKGIKEQLDSANPNMGPTPPPEEIVDFSFEYLVDCIRILVFFENYMKGRLIAQGFVVQLLNKQIKGFTQLAKEQKERPVHIEELQAVQRFVVDTPGRTITHPAILTNTLGIQVLTGTPEYVKHYGYPDGILSVIKEMNAYRNQLHFHNEIQFQLSDAFIENIQAVKDFAWTIVKEIQQVSRAHT